MKDILREIGRIYRCLDSISNVEFKQFDLAKGQYSYLVRICENPGIILERLSEMLKIDRATASRAIQKLEHADLIVKEGDKENKRIQKLFPTDQGLAIYEILKDEESYSNKVALEGITMAEQQTLLDLLQKIQSNLEPEWMLVKRGGQRTYLDKYQKDSGDKDNRTNE